MKEYERNVAEKQPTFCLMYRISFIKPYTKNRIQVVKCKVKGLLETNPSLFPQNTKDEYKQLYLQIHCWVQNMIDVFMHLFWQVHVK